MGGFNPRTSCEVRRVEDVDRDEAEAVSIHAPRVRCDANFKRAVFMGDVSIHAPRVRCDCPLGHPLIAKNSFNPRTSCEVRPHVLR